jgi:metal-responsive CopG/Arc/MetJ family transcriptional regulator
MSCYNIMAVLVSHRVNKAKELQEILTKYGCIIKVRLGLHEAGDVCSEEGLIILQLCGQEEEIIALADELNKLEGIKAKNMQI